MGIQSKTQPYVKFALYCVAVVLINIVGITLFFRLDLTADNKYSLSPASKEVMAKISEPLTIKVFFTKDLPAPHNITEQYLHDLLAEYAANAGKNFNYQFYNVTPAQSGEMTKVSADQKLAEDYGVYPVQVQNIEADEVKVKKAYMGLVIIYGDMVEKITPIKSTDGLEYEITTAIRKLADKISAFANLTEKVDVTLVLSSSLYPVAGHMGVKELPILPERLKQVVADLNDKLDGKLDYSVLDPTKAPEREAELNALNLIRLQWPEIPQQGAAPIPAGKGLIGLVLKYKNNTTTLPVLNMINLPFFGTRYSLPDPKEIGTMIDESLDSLIGINSDIGFLGGHGTPDPNLPNTFGQQPNPPDSLITFRKLLAPNYTLSKIDVAGEGLEKEAIDCLIIASPKEPFTDYELFQIDQFLMRGNNLAIFLDPFKEVTPEGRQSPYAQPKLVPVDTGLEKLLAHYGVKVERATVMDEVCFKQQADPRFGGGEQPLYFAPIINNEYINNKPAFMKNIKGLVVMNVAPIDFLKDTLEANGINAITLFSSSKKSWERKEGVPSNPMFIQPPRPDEARKSYPLAALLEGEFPSYFAGKSIPVKENATDEEKVNETPADKDSQVPKTKEPVEVSGKIITKGKPGKIFIMGSSQMLYDHMLDTEGRSPNAVFMMNLIDTLNGRDKVAQLRSKGQVYNPIFEMDAATKFWIKWGNIAGLPLLVILLGCVVWMRRLSRKRQIRMMFAK
jgi:ABC-type uncharacterized transport system involved in gliding motility auxiliary subunit